MNRSDLDRLQDAWASASDALALGRGCRAREFADDPSRFHEILFRLVVVGEAPGRVTDAVKGLEPTWRDIVDTRNLLVHAYWQIDPSAVAALIELDLAPLIAALDPLIAVLGHDG